MLKTEREKETPKEMMSVGEKDGKVYVKINSSSVSVIQSCERKTLYALEQGLRSNTESPATAYGSAIHAALEVFYSAPLTERVMPTGFKNNLDLMQHGHEIPGEEKHMLYKAVRAFINTAEPFANALPTDKRSIAAGCWTLYHYFKTYLDDPYEVLLDAEGKPYVERAVCYRLFEDESLIVDYFGTIDVILQNKKNGTILVADHKTSSMVGSGFFNRLKPNHQYTGYLLGAQETLGIDTNKFMVNCVEVKSIPKTARGSSPKFPRQVTTRSEEDFAEFREAVVFNVKKYLLMRETGIWPLGDVTTCAAYAGCQFLDVCSAPEKVRGSMIKMKYKSTKELI